ncbi:uncharacterized protein RHO25_011575 [Cercospora beticola]|uniref:BTB domain-containing protein n=1 Tax=Cercospora beticola TaxID=122368 RepID=A0ABZ0P5P6_CERBT|nr:hypothetical protein RHO25_011575 [Cercospora beticola]CAK1366842.1 unnamed protein product [Cercospora beticola]
METNGDDCYNILWQMLKNEKWSDLKIQTATYTFSVHKSVVCPACPFFEAACTGDWKEAGSGIIELPESERTVRSLLEWCYGVFNTDYFTLASGKEDTLRYFELLVAADKYQMPDLKDEVEITFGFAGTASDLVKVALWVYQEERRQAIGVEYMRSLIEILACDMAKILNGDC